MKNTLAILILLASSTGAFAQGKAATEDDYYKLITYTLPEDVVLEVGGLDWLDKAKSSLAACTRRGELWKIDNLYGEPPAPKFQRMLFGLHEPLGVLVKPEGIYMAQRGELSRAKDLDGDGKIDVVEAFCNQWEISGSYHEYAFGPKEDRDGNLWVTLNRPFGGGQEATALWRGWAVKIDKKGQLHPVCPGLRSPCGLGSNSEGDMFYTDNQGDWVAVCKLSHLKPGLFQGQTTGLESCHHPLSTMKPLPKGMPISGLNWGDAVAKMPYLVPPAVWFPYPEMGRSHSDFIYDNTGGKFGPFANQLFVGDQGNAIVVRVCLEKVDGEYQGACFPFRKGFASGVLRLAWGHDGSMFAGCTNRGWGGGPKPYGLNRVVWTGKTPFEVLEMKATPDGYRLTFTEPVDPVTAGDVKSYNVESWTYRYHSNYGDKPQNQHPLKVTAAKVSADGKTVDLAIEGREPFYVDQVRMDGIRNRDGRGLLHPIGYYTLNRIPKKG